MRLSILVLVGFVHATSTIAQTQPPYDDIPSGTVTFTFGQYLEDKFQSQLGRCINGSGKRKLTIQEDKPKKGKTKVLSAIPAPLLGAEMKLDGNVTAERNETLARVLGYVYPSKTLKVTMADEFFLLGIDYVQDPSTMLPQGKDSALYAYSCSATIAAQMKANTGFKFPIAEVSAALQADISRQDASQLGVVVGTFKSPVWEMYKSTTNSAWKLYAKFLMWDWYVRNSPAKTDNVQRYILSQLDGASLYRILQRKRDLDGKLSLAGGLHAGVANLDSSIELAYNEQSKATVENFSVVVRVGADNNEAAIFQNFPALSTLESEITGSAAHLDSQSTNGRLTQGSNSHSQTLAGVPRTMCDHDRWKPEPLTDLGGGTLNVLSTKFAADGDVPSCTFSVVYTPKKLTVGQNRIENVTISYELTSSMGAQKAKIATDAVTLTSNGLPKFEDTTSTGVPVARTTMEGGTTFNGFTYNLPYHVHNDPSDKAASVDPVPETLALTCPKNRTISLSQTKATYDSSTETMTLEATHRAPDLSEKLDLHNWEACSLTGRVSLKLTSGIPVPRDLPTTSVYYRPKQMPSVTGISPAPPPALNHPQTVQISGTNFHPNLSVDLFNADGGKMSTVSGVQQITSLTPTSFKLLMNLAGTAGSYGIEVSNPDGARSQRFGFTTAPNPQVTGLSPSSPPAVGVLQSIAISGRNFQPGLSVEVYNAAGAKISTVAGESIANVTANGFTFSVTLGATPSAYGLEVVNTDGTRSARQVFSTIAAPATPQTP